MVQIKHLSKIILSLIFQLYIPHGSDKTPEIHTSRSPNVFLYIPHGSDKTKQYIKVRNICIDFISHMVQIKRPPYYPEK